MVEWAKFITSERNISLKMAFDASIAVSIFRINVPLIHITHEILFSYLIKLMIYNSNNENKPTHLYPGHSQVSKHIFPAAHGLLALQFGPI